jgi:hypothetical protein
VQASACLCRSPSSASKSSPASSDADATRQTRRSGLSSRPCSPASWLPLSLAPWRLPRASSSRWGRRMAEGGHETVRADEGVVPVGRVRELARLLGRKTMETEILRDALEQARPKNTRCACRCHHTTLPREGRGRHHRRRQIQLGRATPALQGAAARPLPRAEGEAVLAGIRVISDARPPTCGFLRITASAFAGQTGKAVPARRLRRSGPAFLMAASFPRTVRTPSGVRRGVGVRHSLRDRPAKNFVARDIISRNGIQTRVAGVPSSRMSV